jgi:hypothetical protein
MLRQTAFLDKELQGIPARPVNVHGCPIRAQKVWSRARFRGDSVPQPQGVRPDPPDGTAGASVRPLSLGIGVTGRESGIAAYGETGKSDGPGGGPPAG